MSNRLILTREELEVKIRQLEGLKNQYIKDLEKLKLLYDNFDSFTELFKSDSTKLRDLNNFSLFDEPKSSPYISTDGLILSILESIASDEIVNTDQLLEEFRKYKPSYTRESFTTLMSRIISKNPNKVERVAPGVFKYKKMSM